MPSTATPSSTPLTLEQVKEQFSSWRGTRAKIVRIPYLLWEAVRHLVWLRLRCGASEKVHCIQKSDLAGGQFPSNKFGANAAWWQMMVLAFNLVALMKTLVLPESLKNKRMKGLRFHLVNIAGCVVTHARKLIIKVSPHVKVLGLIQDIRKKIAELATPPPRGGKIMI